MNPIMSRISFLVIFFLFTTFANDLKAASVSLYESECFKPGYPDPVNEQSPAAISATITGPSSVCFNSTNQNITFTGYNGISPYTFKYKQDGVSHSIITTGTNAWALLPIITSNVKVYTFELDSVIDSSNKRQVESGIVKVTINTIPTFDFTYKDTQCSGTGVLFTPTLTGNYLYSWDFGDGVSSDEVIPTHVFSVYGTGTKS